MPRPLHNPFDTRRHFLQTLAAMTLAATSARGDDKIPLAPPDKQPPDLEVPKPVEKKIGWAIVGLGVLALEEIMPAFGECHLSRPTALVSGHREKAERVAAYYGITPQNIYNYENYDELARNPDVDVIYIVLPNNMHAEYTIRGLKAGKHVLCEKPMAANVQECRQMMAASQQTGKQLGIAYRLHYEPLNKKVMSMCKENVIGDLKYYSSVHSQDVKAPNIRLSSKLAGGPLGDIGIYSINAARYCLNAEPTEVSAMAFHGDDPRFREVPQTVSYTMRYPGGILADGTCCFSTVEKRRYEVVGSKGWIAMDPAFAYRGLKLSRFDGQQIHDYQIPQVNQFASEMDAFSTSVLENKPSATPGSLGLADMLIIEALERSIESGKTEKVNTA